MAAANDSPDLEALFDEISDAKKAETGGTETNNAADAGQQDPSVFGRVGRTIRSLSNILKQFSSDKIVEQNAANLPDIKARLSHIANVSEQSANKVLNATNAVTPVTEQIDSTATELSSRWEQLFNNQLDPNGLRQLALDSRKFLNEDLKNHNNVLKAQLDEIKATQDFHNFAGQAIKNIANIIHDLENNLVNALLQVVPDDKKNDKVNNLLKDGNTNIEINQEQVDDLLGSLGF